MVRKKGPVWEHFKIENNDDNSHPHVRCKYCSKDFKRAVPERMQTHLDKKCSEAPDLAKSQSRKQNITSRIDNFSEHLSEVKISLESLVSSNDIHYLGYRYQHGIEIEKNEIKAFKLYKQAAEKGHINSMYELGKCYQYGIGIGKNETEAFESYKEAAEKGHIDSIYELVECYQYGIGTEKNEIKACGLYEKVTESQNFFNNDFLGYSYYDNIE
ncbi:hypothetical protein C1645_862285 [Glomus cerebriforme]|uniref:BED-type domain-containing protein n=1 Tax=Glomus cerebriforme TaxID=658196 RepID=A0A397SCS7_9GLOM|nr:hypothetical protein C1645_862285 [Glomus cerebriforme]